MKKLFSINYFFIVNNPDFVKKSNIEIRNKSSRNWPTYSRHIGSQNSFFTLHRFTERTLLLMTKYVTTEFIL